MGSRVEAANGVILDQVIGADNKGYTVLRLWGSHYEMGYAQAQLLADYIVEGVGQIKADLGGDYQRTREVMAGSVWLPAGIEDELEGQVAALAASRPDAGIDVLDLKVVNTQGDWAYAGPLCRSHTCWGRYVEPPVRTISTRRLDYGTPVPLANHHVLCARDPSDGSPRWVNIAWPGFVTSVTGANEFGTLVSSHDYRSFPADLSPGRLPRMVAFRHALTFATGPDCASHASEVFAELKKYELMTGTFLNYYAPAGLGGVITGNPSRIPDFYDLRTPKAVWHHGEAMITTNAWTDGTYTPSDEDFGADSYYNDESPKTHDSHWNRLASRCTGWSGCGLHILSVAYRGRENMTIWADGRMDGAGRTRRLEYEWHQLFPTCPSLSLSPSSASLRLCGKTAILSLDAQVTDPDGDPVTYKWTAEPGASCVADGGRADFAFSSLGDYTVTCTVSDGIHTVSASAAVTVSACSLSLFVGDANCDGSVGVADAVCILGFLFPAGGGEPCMRPCCKANNDTNDDTRVDISDAIMLLLHLFAGGSMIAPDGTQVKGSGGCELYEQAQFLPCETPCAP